MTVQPEEPQRPLIETILLALEAADVAVTSAVDAGIRRFLDRAKDVGTLGEMYGWWGVEVNGPIADAIREAWLQSSITYAGPFTTSSLDGLETYMTRVKDRLVRGLDPPLPEAAFDQVRLSITTGAAHGWSTDRVSQDIAARLSWETRGSYWREQKSEVDRRIDSILDPLGEPGTPAREWAKMHDPTVQALRDQRNFATDRLDDEQSYWKTRATMIARTESTGAFNAAALQSLNDEGWAYKQWLATDDSRTRPTHRLADGQRVKLGVPFIVGGVPLMMPGDPTGAPEEVINCRCVLIGTDEEPAPLELVAAGGFNPDQARVPKGNGKLSGRWIPMPGTVLDRLGAAFTDDQIRALPDSAMDAHDEAAGILEWVLDGKEYDNTDVIQQAADILKAVDNPAFQKAAQDLSDFASVDWYSDPDNQPPTPKTVLPSVPGLPEGWKTTLPGKNRTFVGPHRHRVQFDPGTDFTPEQQYRFITEVDALLKEAAKATEHVNESPVTVDVMNHDEFLRTLTPDMGMLPAESVAAYVAPDDDPNTIRVHPFTVTKTATMPGNPLPARNSDLPFAQSTITHELGHVVGERTPNFRDTVSKGDPTGKDVALWEKVQSGDLGEYAKSAPPEAFAEAWLQWVYDHSENKTSGKATKLSAEYAKQYGWSWTP